MSNCKFEIKDGSITVTYGRYHITGVFLSVCDSRLMWTRGASDKVNAVAEKVGSGDGGGSYFDLHTGEIGFGHKADYSTIATFLRRYGVPENRLRELRLPTAGSSR